MSAVRANGTTASYDHNSRTGTGYAVTLTSDTSAVIRELEANSQGLSYDQMDVRVSAAIRDLIRNKSTRVNYKGEEEHYFEDQDDYDDPNDPGNGGSVSYGVAISNLDNMTLSVDYMAVGLHAPAPVLDRLLRRAIRGPDSMYRKWDIFPEAWEEAPEGENCIGHAALLGHNGESSYRLPETRQRRCLCGCKCQRKGAHLKIHDGGVAHLDTRH